MAGSSPTEPTTTIAERLQGLLPPEALVEHEAVWADLTRIAAQPGVAPALLECLPHLASSLLASANPARALLGLDRLAAAMEAPERLYRLLAARPHLIDILVTLFAGSRFLTEIVLRHPDTLERLGDRDDLTRPRGATTIYAEARGALAGAGAFEERLDLLRRLQRVELLRIGSCDLVCLSDLYTVTAQLSHLADGLIRAALDVAAEATGVAPDGLMIAALGKLGGQELNYSSDVDLVFLTEGEVAPNTVLARALVDVLTRVTGEGFLYRVDLRLRPWGSSGPLVSSLGAYLAYLEKSARLWERQALLKARLVVGEERARAAFVERTSALLFAPGPDPRAEVRAMKQRIETQLDASGAAWGEVKLGRGSIRDVEFVTQYLQLRHGAQYPELRSANTLAALARLHARGLLAPDAHRALSEGYTFLRPVEHYLQMMDHRQTHRLPADPRELEYLARRLGFAGSGAGAEFLARYHQHGAAIRAVFDRYLGEEAAGAREGDDDRVAPAIVAHVRRMAPSYHATFGDDEIARHAEMVARIDDAHPVEVAATPQEDGAWRVTVVGYDYPGELSLICGLLFVYGLTIDDGHVFTYEQAEDPATLSVWSPHARRRAAENVPDRRLKIVDVFTVRSVSGQAPADMWPFYEDDLTALLQHLQRGQPRSAYGEIAKRAALAIEEAPGAPLALQPIDIAIDNDASERYTVLRIEAPDTPGFLYEFTSALALSGVYIAQMSVDSAGSRARDVLYLTDSGGAKIVAPAKQRELRAVTVLVKHFAHLLPRSPNPESALLHFRDLLSELLARPDWPDELSSLERPEVLGALARLLGVSDFLWEDFMRLQHADLLPLVKDLDALAEAKPPAQLREELFAALAAAPGREARRAALNAFKDREMFRIDMRHIQGQSADFGRFAAELTDLTEVVVDVAQDACRQDLAAAHGEPRTEDGRPCPLSVVALGKCGGREMGFASDVELMFVFEANGVTAGPNAITTAEFYEKVVVAFLDTIRARRAGIFEIDLRLRPFGAAGSMAVSLEAFQRYFGPEGHAWPYERQALIKLRPIAGDPALGARLAALRDAYVFTGRFDATAMRAMRERQVRHLVSGGTFNAKFSPGGLVDCEYLVQGLQITHGREDADLRVTNTHDAIQALAAVGVLSPTDRESLTEAYAFLRRLIDALRMVRGNAKDLTVPAADSEEFAFLARRLSYGSDLARLRRDLEAHSRAVQDLSRELLG